MSIKPPDLTWQADQPFNLAYQDIYYSDHARDGGCTDVVQFFLEPAQIAEKAARLPRGQRLVVGELGFGSALNFALCAQHMVQAGHNLHFISFEKHPFSPDQWRKVALSRHHQLPIYNSLSKNPLPLLPGWHQRRFANGAVKLSVFHGEAAAGLEDLHRQNRQRVDAWLLDGFAPDRNPDLWSADICSALAALSNPGATVATFTAAGQVRRHLEGAGFNVRKQSQAPFKRESLVGEIKEGNPLDRSRAAPVDIHGAGLAGATLARHLAEDNFEVRVSDIKPPASGGSQITCALLHGRLLGNNSPEALLRVQAYLYAADFYQGFDGVEQTGVLQTCAPNLPPAKMARISKAYGGADDHQAWIQHLPPPKASQLAGTNLAEDALWFPHAAVVNMPALVADLLNHPNITTRISSTTHTRSEAGQPLILCTANACQQVPELSWLEITNVWGQLDLYTRGNRGPRLPIIGNGYYVPVQQSGCVLGATYEHQPWFPSQATQHNFDNNAHFFISSQSSPALPRWQSRQRAPRCVSSDRVPVVGPVGDNLWLSTAFGSMGTSMAPLAAALITGELGGSLIPFDPAALALLRPQRFLQRQARRGIRHRAKSPER